MIDYRTAGVLLIDRNGALLMQHRDEHARISPNKWGIPGGRIEAGETPIVAAHRELQEETGLIVDDLQPFWSGPRPHEPGVTHPITMYAYCGWTNAAEQDIVLGEGRWIGFVTPELALDRDLFRLGRIVGADVSFVPVLRGVARPGCSLGWLGVPRHG